jgi:type I restriction enzyme M protein
MLGAIIGDIVGSRFEMHNIKSKEFSLFDPHCRVTDDSILSLAICQALMESEGHRDQLPSLTIKNMRLLGNKYPNAGYGEAFLRWLSAKNPQPYESFGNGATMRVSGCAFFAKNLEEAQQLARCVTQVTHNHPEALKGAEALTVAIYMAREGKSISDIKHVIVHNYYPITFTLDSIRKDYTFSPYCQTTVPEAFEAFFESTSFEDAIRLAISIGGDSDTIAAMTGSLADAYYGIPRRIRNQALPYLDQRLQSILFAFEKAIQD